MHMDMNMEMMMVMVMVVEMVMDSDRNWNAMGMGWGWEWRYILGLHLQSWLGGSAACEADVEIRVCIGARLMLEFGVWLWR